MHFSELPEIILKRYNEEIFMIDLNKLEKYRENNRIEAKTALGGLPESIWETYSAFANTLGGIILLGVREDKDKSLYAVDLPDPKKLEKLFWDAVNNPQKASVNILSTKDVRIEKVDGKSILVINVPRAERSYKPVYVYGNPLNTYRRNGEGDYKCTKEEYQAMVRDASVKSQDMLILEEMSVDVFNAESVRGYRMRMQNSRPGHFWETLDDEEFLLKMGAVGIGEDGKRHPTTGGLLMFGNENDIVRIFPQYFLDYREETLIPGDRWADRIISSSGDWSGNVMDFYFRVYNKLQLDLKKPFRLQNGLRVDDTPVHKAVREALANSLVNADYYGRGGVVVVKTNGYITFSNPGTFRIDVDAAIGGGVSDPRNSVLMKMFNMIDIGERAGSGIPNIFRVWKEQGWQEPIILQMTEPDRTRLILYLLQAEDYASTKIAEDAETDYIIGDKERKIGEQIKNYETIGDKNTIIGEQKESGRKIGDKIGEQNTANRKNGDKDKLAIKMVKRQMIIDYLTDQAEATIAELSEYLNLKSSRVRDYLRELISDEIVVPVGGKRNRTYKLKW